MTPSETQKYPGRSRQLREETIALGLASLRRVDFDSFRSVLVASEELGCTHLLVRAIRLADPIGEAVRRSFLQNWIKSGGDEIREAISRDLDLIAMLRLLMPAYQGPEVVLYLGESATNRAKKAYGISWSADRNVAEEAANRIARSCQGGGVLLKTAATPAAIITAIPSSDDHPGAYLVDRRLLGKVEIIRRFEQA